MLTLNPFAEISPMSSWLDVKAIQDELICTVFPVFLHFIFRTFSVTSILEEELDWL